MNKNFSNNQLIKIKVKRRAQRSERVFPRPKWCEQEQKWVVADYRGLKRMRIRFRTLEMAEAHCQVIRAHYLNAEKVSESGFSINPSLAVAWAFLDEELRIHHGTDLIHVAQDFLTGQTAAILTTPRGRHLFQMLAALGALTPPK